MPERKVEPGDAFADRAPDGPSVVAEFPGIIYQCCNDKHWTMRFVSDGCLEMTGYRPEDLVDNTTLAFCELIHPGDRDYVRREVEKAVKTDAPYSFEYRICDREKRQKWVFERGHGVRSPDGELLGLEGVIIDMTRAKDLEAVLRARLQEIELYAEIVKGMQEGLLVYRMDDARDDRSLRLVSANPACGQMVGMAVQDMLGKTIDELFPALRERGVPQLFAEVVRTRSPRQVEELLYGVEGNPEAVWSFKAFPLPGDQVGIVFEDITEKKGLEHQFAQAQKMEIIGRLSAGIAHDFNNILTGILAFVDFLKVDDTSVPDLEEIRQLTRRATELTRDLMVFSRQDTPVELEQVDLNELLEDTINVLRRTLGTDIELKTTLEPELKSVQADPKRIVQAVMNLAINSKDAMPEGGKLEIETSNATLSRSDVRRRPGLQPGDYVVVSVKDTGCGMDQKTVDRIFEPFFTTKKEGEGTGLGLASVLAVVKRHDGAIFVQSAPGKGTTFDIYLPQAAASA